MNIPDKATRAEWRRMANEAMISAVGECTPEEFTILLDAVDALEAENIELRRKAKFRFDMGQKVEVTLAGIHYTGKIISRLESHTGGINYAVWADYKHARGSEWFMESELSLAGSAQ